MFYNCDNLTTIYSDTSWDIDNVTNSRYMFYGCTHLVGGENTTYDANHIDKEYAHVDGGPSNPGYFTATQAFVPGDLDGDGEPGLSDAAILIDAILTGDMTGIDVEVADVDGNGVVDIGDIAALIDYLLTGEWP